MFQELSNEHTTDVNHAGSIQTTHNNRLDQYLLVVYVAWAEISCVAVHKLLDPQHREMPFHRMIKSTETEIKYEKSRLE